VGDTIFSSVWYGLVLWTCLAPNGYAPYVLLGVNGGDFLVTIYCGLKYGYPREEGDFCLGRFLMTSIAFALLGGCYAWKISFQPGSDAYNNALGIIFAAFWLTFGYRLFQYGIGHVLGGHRNRSAADAPRSPKGRTRQRRMTRRRAPNAGIPEAAPARVHT